MSYTTFAAALNKELTRGTATVVTDSYGIDFIHITGLKGDESISISIDALGDQLFQVKDKDGIVVDEGTAKGKSDEEAAVIFRNLAGQDPDQMKYDAATDAVADQVAAQLFLTVNTVEKINRAADGVSRIVVKGEDEFRFYDLTVSDVRSTHGSRDYLLHQITHVGTQRRHVATVTADSAHQAAQLLSTSLT